MTGRSGPVVGQELVKTRTIVPMQDGMGERSHEGPGDSADPDVVPAVVAAVVRRRHVERNRIVAAIAILVVVVSVAGMIAAASDPSTLTGADAMGDHTRDSGSTVPTVGRTTVPLLGGSDGTATTLRPPAPRPPATVADAVPDTTSEAATPSTDVVDTAPALSDVPSVVARPIPVGPPPPPPAAPPAPWAASVVVTADGQVSTDVGCARDLSAGALDEFFAARVGPVIGWDYQHVYPLGGNRYLWLFQDTFIDQSNTAATLDRATFTHNSAMVQDGKCFRLLHRGTVERPLPFEPGTGTRTLSTWFWPMGGEVHDGRLHVFWARMTKDTPDPRPPDGLGWHPDATFVATYDPNTLARLDFRQATQGGSSPIYGYAVQSEGDWTYLFANTFEQNLAREGGWSNGPHSGTKTFLGRVRRGRIFDQPEYWTPGGWIQDRRLAVPIVQRGWAEFPFQPRLVDGQWVAATAVNGYWGDEFELDVANEPWGPWTTVERRPLVPRGGDPKMNTYHAHLLPWRDGYGQLVVSVSNNARDMLRDAWPNPARYRPNIFATSWVAAPPDPVAPPPASAPPATTVAPTTTTTVVPTTTTIVPTTTTIVPTTTTTTSATTTSTTTIAPTTTPATTTSTIPATTSSSSTIPPTFS